MAGEVIFNTPLNTPNYSSGGNYGTNWLSSAAGALGNWINRNPNQFAIMADTIGSKLAPNNPFAGVGTTFGKSAIAAEEAASGNNKLSMLERLIQGLTETGKPGGNNITIKANPNGGYTVNTSTDLKDLNNPTQTPVLSDKSANDQYGVLSSFVVNGR
jgi:hypothetical protein